MSMPRHVLVHVLWERFDENCAESVPSFEKLLAMESRRLILDVRALTYFNSPFPACLGPSSLEDAARSERDYTGRWVLAGLAKRVRIVMAMQGLTRFLELVESCPDCGGILDLDRRTCASCGPFETIVWGPGELRRTEGVKGSALP